MAELGATARAWAIGGCLMLSPTKNLIRSYKILTVGRVWFMLDLEDLKPKMSPEVIKPTLTLPISTLQNTPKGKVPQKSIPYPASKFVNFNKNLVSALFQNIIDFVKKLNKFSIPFHAPTHKSPIQAQPNRSPGKIKKSIQDVFKKDDDLVYNGVKIHSFCDILNVAFKGKFSLFNIYRETNARYEDRYQEGADQRARC